MPHPCRHSIHWQQKVHDDLLRDEAMKILEKVPHGEPTQWCHRMVITRKDDESPRRTVDLSPLNKFCKRETHAFEAPFHLACRVPRNKWKTVTDACSSVARGGGGGGGYSPPIGLPTKMQNKENTTFLALLRLFVSTGLD